MSEGLLAWIMCVEYVHDLVREPCLDPLKPLRSVPDMMVRACRILAQHVRERHAVEYEQAADHVESLIAGDIDHKSARDLGRIDTFRREESRVLEAAVEALVAGRWQEAHEWAEGHPPASFWLQRDPSRRMAWQLIHHAADLGLAIAEDAGLRGCRPAPASVEGSRPRGASPADAESLRDALERYTQHACLVDRAHRRYEQERLKMLDQRLPHFARLLEATERLRREWRAWADGLCRDFNALCSRVGFLPEPDLQQRTLYEQVVHPMLASGEGRVAYFVIDAFRYEMALDLLEGLQEAGHTVRLSARLAELPTVTAVGMNALASVARDGRVGLVINESGGVMALATHAFIVRTPDDRLRAMGERSFDPASPRRRWRLMRLGEVCELAPETLKDRVKDYRMLVIHGQEIDDAGEANVGLASFETWLSQIRSAFLHLKAAGVTSFVFTADHGFLLQDSTMSEQPFGTVREPRRRYVVSAERRAEAGLVAASMNELGYDARDGRDRWFHFREDTAVFATGTPGAGFVHGGNSLQERVVPVLQVTVRRKATGVREKYHIAAEVLPEVLGYARIRVRAQSDEPLLRQVVPPILEVALRAPERPHIRVQVKEVHGGATLVNQTLRLEVDGD